MKYSICFAIITVILSTVNCQTDRDCIKHPPICGDGVTYRDTCSIETALITNPKLKFRDGECTEIESEQPRRCNTNYYKPVCGSDNVTYNNSCLFLTAKESKQNLTLTSEGACNENEKCVTHPALCGSDGSTYSNTCSLKSAVATNPELNFTVGECNQQGGEESVFCNTNVYEPVCGSNGVVYGNLCLFNIAQNSNPEQLLNYTNGTCSEEKKPKCSCQPIVVDPSYCGSNGKLYNNLCELKCAKKSNSYLKAVNLEFCLRKPIRGGGQRICTQQYDPVCGSDGKIYGNSCMCGLKQETNPSLTCSKGTCSGGRTNV